MRKLLLFPMLFSIIACSLFQSAPSVPTALPTPTKPAPTLQTLSTTVSDAPPVTATSLPATTQPTETPLPVPSPAPTEPPASASLENVTLTLPETGTVTLQNGIFSDGNATLSLIETMQAFENERAAALFSLSLGGSGNFVYLVAFQKENGDFLQQAPAVFIEDRPELHQLKIENEKILLDATLHGNLDPLCCPSEHTVLTFALTQWGLQLQKISTFTPEDIERRITITSPTEYSETLTDIEVTGFISLMPPDKTLQYRYVTAGELQILTEGSIPVTPKNPNNAAGEGVFAAVLPAPPVPVYANIQLQILEIDSPSTSPVAMDSVWISIQ